MQIVASYFDVDKAAVACETLKQAGILFEQTQQNDESGESLELSVAEEWVDKAADILEKLEESFLEAEGHKPMQCSKCGSANITRDQKSSSFGHYDIYVCGACKNVAVRRA